MIRTNYITEGTECKECGPNCAGHTVDVAQSDSVDVTKSIMDILDNDKPLSSDVISDRVIGPNTDGVIFDPTV